MKKNLLPALLLGLIFGSGCSDDDVSTSSPFTQDVVEIPVTPPALDVGFDQTEFTVAEGGDAVTVLLNLAAAAPAGGTITVARIDADSSTATASDYTATFEGKITISEGDESKEFSIQAVDDTELEEDEVVYFSVTSDVEILGLTTTVLKVNITSNEIPEILVVIDTNTGELFSIDTESNDSTKLLTLATTDYIEDDDEVVDRRELIEARHLGRGIKQRTQAAGDTFRLRSVFGFVYNPDDGYGYASSYAFDEEGLSTYPAIYQVDMSTGMSKLFTKQQDNAGIMFAFDMLIQGVDLITVGMVSENEFFGGGAITIDLLDGVIGGLMTEPEPGPVILSAVTKGPIADSIYYSGTIFDDGIETVLLQANMDGIDSEFTNIELSINPDDAADFGDGYDIQSQMIYSMVESSTGIVYALVGNPIFTEPPVEGYQFILVELDLETGEASYVRHVVTTEHDQIKIGLAMVPENLF